MIDAYELARKRIIRKKRFYQHFTIFLAVILFLFLLNVVLFITTWWHYIPGRVTEDLTKEILQYPYWWFQYPLLGWGMFLFIHYCQAFGIPLVGQYDEKWEAEAIEAEVLRIERKAQGLKPTSAENSMELKTLEKEKILRKDTLKDSELL